MGYGEGGGVGFFYLYIFLIFFGSMGWGGSYTCGEEFIFLFLE